MNEHNEKSSVLTGIESQMLRAFESYSRNSNPGKSEEAIIKIQKLYFDILKYQKPLVINGVKINLNSEVWDFSKLIPDGKNRGYIYHFNMKNSKRVFEHGMNEFRVAIRLYALLLIDGQEIHKGNNNGKFNTAKAFLFYCEDNYVYSINDINLDIIKNFCETGKLTYNGFVKKKRLLGAFIRFIADITDTQIPYDINSYLVEADVNKVNANIENNKTPLLSDDFYNIFVTTLYEKYYKERNSREKGLLGLLFILTQTGLRVNEVLMLTSDSLETIKEDALTLYCLNYRSTKNARGGSHYSQNKIAINEKTARIFNSLLERYDNVRINKKTNKLVPSNNKKLNYEYTPRELFQTHSSFCIKNAKKLGLINAKCSEEFCGKYVFNRLSRKPVKGKSFSYQCYINKDINVGDTISYPIFRQFRVYYATYLHNIGVSDIMISNMLGHTTINLVGYYVRQKHPIQEDIDYSKELLEEIITDDLEILGDKGRYYKDKINEIINNNSFNIKTDLDEIINCICNEMPIRMKSCGFCIKSNKGRSCDYDANTDEFKCAYGCCLNHCHLYYDLPNIYKKCIEQEKIIMMNDKNGFINYSQKECFKLESIINRELVPELKALEKEIILKGAEHIISRHKSMKPIIGKLNEIKRSVELWKKLINNHTKRI